MTTKGSALRNRIIAVHAKHTGAESDYGAMTWFGHHCDVSRRAVYRWCDEGKDRGEHMRILRLLEAMPIGTPWARNPRLLDAELPALFPAYLVLVDAGYKSQADVYHARDEDLLKVEGVGPSTLRRIREWWSEPKKPQPQENGR